MSDHDHIDTLKAAADPLRVLLNGLRFGDVRAAPFARVRSENFSFISL